MSNLTFQHRLLWEHTPDPLEGYAVVVFQRVGAQGDGVIAVLEPGAAPLRPKRPLFFGKAAEYFAYAVDAYTERQIDFPESIQLGDHVTGVQVTCELAYAVADARTLAVARNKDPLGEVVKKLRAVVRRELAKLDWNEAWESFASHAASIVASTLGEVRGFGERLGIAVDTYRLTLHIPEDLRRIFEDERKAMLERDSRDRRERQDRILTVRGEALAVEAELSQGRTRFTRAAIDATVAALGRGEPESVDDLLRQFPELRLHPSTRDGFGAEADGFARLPQSSGGRPSLPPAASAADPLTATLVELVSATDVVHSSAQMRKLRAALLHLVAEVLVDGDALEACAATARRVVEELDPSPGGEPLEGIQRFTEAQLLRRRLGC